MKKISLYCLLISAMFVMAGCASNHSLDESSLEKKTIKKGNIGYHTLNPL
jgi:ABC-type phosphate/phosphonate transport system substrate-binding protein